MKCQSQSQNPTGFMNSHQFQGLGLVSLDSRRLTCRRGICIATASTVSAPKAGVLAASFASSRASLSAAARKLDLRQHNSRANKYNLSACSEKKSLHCSTFQAARMQGSNFSKFRWDPLTKIRRLNGSSEPCTLPMHSRVAARSEVTDRE